MYDGVILFYLAAGIPRAEDTVKHREKTSARGIPRRCKIFITPGRNSTPVVSAPSFFHPDVIMAGKRNAGEVGGGDERDIHRRSGPACTYVRTAGKKENQHPWSDRNSNRSRTIQMTVRVRSRGRRRRRRRRAQSAAIYFCLPTPASVPFHFVRARPLIFTPSDST